MNSELNRKYKKFILMFIFSILILTLIQIYLVLFLDFNQSIDKMIFVSFIGSLFFLIAFYFLNKDENFSYNDLINNLLIGICVWDGNGKLLKINKGFTEITGYDMNDIKNVNDWFLRAYPDENYRNTVINSWNEALSADIAIKTFKINCKDGSIKDLEFRATFTVNNKSIVSFTDITENIKRTNKTIKKADYLKRVITTIPEIILILDEDGYYSDIWSTGHKALIKSEDELIGKNINQVLPKTVVNNYMKYIKLAIKTNEIVEFNYFLMINNVKTFFKASIVILDYHNNKNNMLVVIRDITETVLSENIIKEAKERLELAIEIAGLGIWEHNIVINETGYYDNWAKSLGYEDDEVEKTYEGWAKMIHLDDRDEVINEFQKVLDGTISIFKKKYRLRKKDGSYRWIYDIGKIISKNRKGNPIKIIGVHFDIDETMKNQEKIEYLSYRDGLTSLYNRRYFENEIERLSKSRKLPISIVIGDMDRLKYINDTYGHKIGDAYLLQVSKILNEITRKDEVVARIGGDEFAIILTEVYEDDIKDFCKRVNNEIQDFNFMKILPENLSISLGYALKTTVEDDLNDIFIKADLAMYEKKKEKRKLRN
ncbi:diguanylate cyclase [Clostridiaceae bacterium HSG29]|nr:diguanylate cyclase [Clostridiaceae bacterium HSG29]